MPIKNLHVIVGLGATGLSCLRYLLQQNIPVAVTDTRDVPPGLAMVEQQYPQVLRACGALSERLLDQASVVVCSPGVSSHEPMIAKQRARGVPILGDIELFAQAANAPILAITGSNAKSTVTTLVANMVAASGCPVKAGGNLGVPALDLLDDTNPPQAYVLELSSFQLETTYTLRPRVATVLNVSPDHLDRYPDFQAYRQAKQRIYQGCQIAVCNRDDVNTACGGPDGRQRFYFTLQEPAQNEFGLLRRGHDIYLAFENNILMPVAELPVRGRHYQANALAALAIGHGFGLSFETMLAALREFKGLAHRCQLVRERQGVYWYNDSKGTNVGATVAAMEGLGCETRGKLILIAGGVGKNADFLPLLAAASQYVRTAILIGEAAPMLAKTLEPVSEIILAKDLAAAVGHAEQKAQRGDSVLLSPACASYDMFRNYEHRGEVFMQLVQEL